MLDSLQHSVAAEFHQLTNAVNELINFILQTPYHMLSVLDLLQCPVLLIKSDP